MGRPRGSKNVATERLRKDILRTYRQMGGQRWLAKWAEDNPTEFAKLCLARVMPPMPRADEENDEPRPIGDTPALEVAKRLAFVLASGVHAQNQQEARPQPRTIDAERVTPAPAPTPEPEAEPQYTTGDPFKGLPDEPLPTPKRKEEDLTNYYGSSAEHTGPAPHPPEVRVERRTGRPRRKLV